MSDYPEIVLCPERDEDSGGRDITVCPERDEDSGGRDITVCPGECANPPELSLSGDEEATVGSQYSVTGGVPPYNWSISCGSIDGNGQITDLSGCCGSGTVSVTDYCGQSQNMAVRFPSGQWVLVGWETSSTLFFDWTDCNAADPNAYECQVTTSCSGVPAEFVSIDGRCAFTNEARSCFNDFWGWMYQHRRFYCRPIEEWQCP